MGTLVIETKFLFLNFLLYLFRPVAVVNGEARKVKWGRTEIPVEAGEYQVEFSFKYFWVMDAGKANAFVEVPEGGRATVVYKAPILVMFQEGSTTVV